MEKKKQEQKQKGIIHRENIEKQEQRGGRVAIGRILRNRNRGGRVYVYSLVKYRHIETETEEGHSLVEYT